MFKIKRKKKKIQFFNIFINSCLSLILVGSFLLPNCTYAADITENNIIELTNIERIKNNIKPLKKNQLLSTAAQNKAEAIIKNGIFSHSLEDNSFSKWIKETGYEYSFIGENLAIDFVSSEGTINAWLQSTTHRENLLNERFEEIGVAIYEGKFNNENTILIVQIFGTPNENVNSLSTNKNNFKNEEKLFVRFEDNKILNDDSNIITRTIPVYPLNEQNQIDTYQINANPLTSSSVAGEFFSILFAIIISSLIVSVMFPDGIKVKKIKLKFLLNIKKIIKLSLKTIKQIQ